MIKEIYFAGGCFWGTQHLIKQIRGVVSTEVGYANGTTQNPTYEEVYTDTTGHVETVRIEYDSEVVSLNLLLEIYFRSIDPTSLNRQGGDSGTRYRTGIYYTDTDDIVTINEMMAAIEQDYDEEIVVEVEPLSSFYPAEEHHQDYLDKNPTGYCHIPYWLIDIARNMNR
ncbi:MAG: peptide-methionine (S)-S-oxide reductase MsrA [Alistipes sp.]|nr:peptide-methionine (S)-S-oxide reductase MsrA [Alistipes sp.]